MHTNVKYKEMLELLIKGLKQLDVNKIDNLGLLMMKGLFELRDDDKNLYKFKAALDDEQ